MSFCHPTLPAEQALPANPAAGSPSLQIVQRVLFSYDSFPNSVKALQFEYYIA